MTQPTLPQSPRDVAEPRRAHGWWALVLTVLIFGTLLFLVGVFGMPTSPTASWTAGLFARASVESLVPIGVMIALVA
ncbi:hypothetical protein [Pseudoclavibacter sp. 8L]|uniref:hypothetical protein n=1 Tax=Pseudoclavibacter sp. 8L TaxID=2653162 RepID=UPI0012F3D004|nr:hypothetical protein [Pseudoclavibacter sp. 8L]VXC09656.1 hypothetical protein PSCLAVI8L_320097 [Pseudoclavibacter sp. 8L]